MTIEDLLASLNDRIAKLERKTAGKKKKPNWRDIKWDSDWGDVYQAVIEPMLGKGEKDPGIVFDDLYNVWYSPTTADYTIGMTQYGPPDTYEFIRGFYWVPWILEPIEDFLIGTPKDIRAKVRAEIGALYENIQKKYDEAEKEEEKATGTPGNRPEEAQFYNNKVVKAIEEIYDTSKEAEKKSEYALKLSLISNFGDIEVNGYEAEATA